MQIKHQGNFLIAVHTREFRIIPQVIYDIKASLETYFQVSVVVTINRTASSVTLDVTLVNKLE